MKMSSQLLVPVLLPRFKRLNYIPKIDEEKRKHHTTAVTQTYFETQPLFCFFLFCIRRTRKLLKNEKETKRKNDGLRRVHPIDCGRLGRCLLTHEVHAEPPLPSGFLPAEGARRRARVVRGRPPRRQRVEGFEVRQMGGKGGRGRRARSSSFSSFGGNGGGVGVVVVEGGVVADPPGGGGGGGGGKRGEVLGESAIRAGRGKYDGM